LRMAHDLHRCRRAFQCEWHLDINGYAGANIDISLEPCKSLRGHGQVIRIRRQVAKDKLATRVRRRTSLQSGDRVTQLDAPRYHCAARRILDCSLERASAPEFLARAGKGAQDDSRDEPGDPEERAHPDLSRVHEASFRNPVMVDPRRYQGGDRSATRTTRMAK